MKVPRMQMTIWTRASIGSARFAERFLEALGQFFPEAFPPRWGECDPLSIRASKNEYADVVSLWQKMGHERSGVMGHGPSIGLHINFMLGPTKKPHEIWFRFPEKLVHSSRALEHSLKLFGKWVGIVNIDFALFCAEGEWVSKNVILDYMEEDGYPNPWKIFGNDITQGLPGVYWGTYVGESLVQWLGEDHISTSPWPHVEKVGKGYLLRRSEDPTKWSEAKDLDDKLLDHLGRKYFFDITDLDRKVKVPPLNIP